MNKISKQIPQQNDVMIANKHMKRYLVSYGIRELWIKTAINYFIFSRMTKFQKTQHQMLVRVWNNKNSYSLLQRPQNRMQNATLSVQSLSRVWLFVTPWIAARQASLSNTNSRSPPKLMSIKLVMPSNHLILCPPLLLLPSIFPSIRVFPNEPALHTRWPKDWGFNFSISPSK